MASMRSLIINPSTPQPTISSVLQTLIRLLQHSTDKALLHHTLNLLTHLAFHHSSLSQFVFDFVYSHSLHSAHSTRLATESLQVLASISECVPALSLNMDQLDDGFFVSLCFGPSVSARLWLLKNAGCFQIRPSVLFTLFLGFTKDPYPYVRKASLDGLVGLSEHGVFEDPSLVDGCYHCGVQLLGDMEDCVRSSAVRVVASWGLMLAASNADMKSYWSNEVFAKVRYRDDSLPLPPSYLTKLGLKIAFMWASHVLYVHAALFYGKRHEHGGVVKQREVLGQNLSEQFKLLAASVAGALVHGLEDEFFEVRKCACESLQRLTILSVEFAHEALNFLMDVLNDDSVVVRVQALETMHHMAINGCLKVQEKHMHMFLGVLVDNCMEVRYAARKILKLAKLNNLMFKSSIDALLGSLCIYPQDEADVFSALFHIGRNRKKFVAFITKEVFEEVEAAFEGNSENNRARVAALVVLCISASLSHSNVGTIPPVLFSYAVTLLGRIHSAFTDVMDRDALLAFLSNKSRSIDCSATNINHGEGEQWLPLVEGDSPYYAGNEVISVPETSEKIDLDSEIQSHFMREPKVEVNSLVEKQPVNDEVMMFVNCILVKVPDIWPLIQCGFTNEALRILRCWKEELATMMFDSSGSSDALAFAFQYIRIIKLLAEVWEHFLSEKWLWCRVLGELDYKLAKLDTRVKELRTQFKGFSTEEEINVLELILLTFTLRLCKVEICCHILTLKRLTAILSRIEFLLKESSAVPSTFVDELRKLCESGTSINGASCSPLEFHRCLKFFSLKQFIYRRTLKHLHANLRIPNNDSEHPFPFVPGLPVGIECEISLRNIESEHRLWLSMSMDDGASPQYVFLDSNLFEGSGQVRRCAFVAPFYRTPKANSFRLRICIGLECLFENVAPVQTNIGPRHEVTFLCPEKEVYFSNVLKTK
ncbi:protein SIEL [Senna tora]|uniref:Protein SIEL n=1 Tax=Senna tora TaxID=362788 RepID=A0A834WLQ1_9FABA|nr:protein SIEL [Senna tora]